MLATGTGVGGFPRCTTPPGLFENEPLALLVEGPGTPAVLIASAIILSKSAPSGFITLLFPPSLSVSASSKF